MITIDKTAEHVLAMRLAGIVEKAEIKKLAQEFEDKFAANDRVNLVAMRFFNADQEEEAWAWLKS